MKKVLVFLACFSTISALETDLGIGVRKDSLQWSIGMYPRSPDVLSELQWKNIWSVNGFAAASVPLFRNLSVSGWINGGKIFGGEVWDRDYWGNNRTEMFSESHSLADQGYVFDGSAAIAQSTPVGSGVLSEVFGFSYHRLHLTMIGGWQNDILNDIYHSPMPLLNSHYTAQFFGPFFGIDYQLPLANYLLGLGYTFTLPRFKGEGFWNLRSDMTGNFTQGADKGFGHTFFVTLQMPIQSNFKVGFTFQGRYFKVYNGLDHIYCKEEDEEIHVVQKLNEARWKNLSVYLFLEYFFDNTPKRMGTRERLSHILQARER